MSKQFAMEYHKLMLSLILSADNFANLFYEKRFDHYLISWVIYLG